MLTPPPSLTRMERQLLLQVQKLEQHLQSQLAEQDRNLALMQAQISARDQSISDLSDLLTRLLAP